MGIGIPTCQRQPECFLSTNMVLREYSEPEDEDMEWTPGSKNRLVATTNSQAQ